MYSPTYSCLDKRSSFIYICLHFISLYTPQLHTPLLVFQFTFLLRTLYPHPPPSPICLGFSYPSLPRAAFDICTTRLIPMISRPESQPRQRDQWRPWLLNLGRLRPVPGLKTVGIPSSLCWKQIGKTSARLLQRPSKQQH